MFEWVPYNLPYQTCVIKTCVNGKGPLHEIPCAHKLNHTSQDVWRTHPSGKWISGCFQQLLSVAERVAFYVGGSGHLCPNLRWGSMIYPVRYTWLLSLHPRLPQECRLMLHTFWKSALFLCGNSIAVLSQEPTSAAQFADKGISKRRGSPAPRPTWKRHALSDQRWSLLQYRAKDNGITYCIWTKLACLQVPFYYSE